MKIEALIESLLEEGISPIVFHSTGIFNALKILTSNRFELSNATKSSTEMQFSKKLFYMSTARTKLNNFSYTSGSNIVTFTLNGRTLANNLTSEPIDFFHYEGRVRPRDNTSFEFEDRVVSDKPIIQNFTRYLLEVSVLLNGNITDEVVIVCRRLNSLCKKHNIKFGIYTGKSDFLRSTNDISNEIINRPTFSEVRPITDNANKYKYEYSSEIDLFTKFLYLSRSIQNKKFKGNSVPTSMKDFVSKLEYGDSRYIDSLAWDLKVILSNNEITSIPELSSQISYVYKNVRTSGLQLHDYLKRELQLIKDAL